MSNLEIAIIIVKVLGVIALVALIVTLAIEIKGERDFVKHFDRTFKDER